MHWNSYLAWVGEGGEERVNGATGRSHISQNMAFSEYLYLEPCKYPLLKKIKFIFEKYTSWRRRVRGGIMGRWSHAPCSLDGQAVGGADRCPHKPVSKADRRELPWVQGSGEGELWSPTPLLTGQGLPKPFSTHS